MLANSVQTIAFNFSVALIASWRDVLFKTEFTIELAVFLHETDILKWAPACRIYANEMFGTPDAAQGSYKRTSNISITGST